MLHGDCQSVLEARNEDEFRHVVLRFAKRLGFDLASAITVFDRPGQQSRFVTIDNAPLAFLQDYCDPVRCQRDPVMQHCRRHGLPIAWGQSLYLQCDAMDLWETQAQFGYRHGVAVAFHLPHGRHFMVGVDRDQPLPSNPVELARTTADLLMFTAHAQEAALRLFDGGQGKIEFKNLSRRELEALRWTLDGKTAHEVGAVLGIAERTANLHLRNGMKKLACSSKHQAALKALRLGLIY